MLRRSTGENFFLRVCFEGKGYSKLTLNFFSNLMINFVFFSFFACVISAQRPHFVSFDRRIKLLRVC